MDSNEIIDFEGTMQTPNNGGGANSVPEDTTNLSGKEETENITGKDNSTQVEDKTKQEVETNDEDVEVLEPGSTIEYDGNIYTMQEDGSLVDDKGNVFKTAEEVDEFLDSLETDEDDESENLGEFTIENIQNAVGLNLLDAQGNVIDFPNSIEGVTNYINQVIDLKSKEASEATLNSLYTELPEVKDFINYIAVNGTYKGFESMPDREHIILNKEDENLQIGIIRTAAAEFGNASLNDNYIGYLKQSGTLYDEAKVQLQNLIEKDRQTRKNLEEEANRIKLEQQKQQYEYNKQLYNTVKQRKIGNYVLPENFIREKEGRKYNVSLDDFYNYMTKRYNVDGNLFTEYEFDLERKSQEDKINQAILNAWLTFTGGTYKDLVNMAINEANVKALKLKAKQAKTKGTIKLKPKSKTNTDDIIFE